MCHWIQITTIVRQLLNMLEIWGQKYILTQIITHIGKFFNIFMTQEKHHYSI